MPVDTGTRAPDFELKDAAEGLPHALGDALGRGPVLLGIYKASCNASKTAFLFMERLAQHYPKDRLTVWGVAQDSPNVTRSFARRVGVSFPLLIDENAWETSRAYDIVATPTLFLVDRDGTILWQGMGFQKFAINELNDKLAELLGSEPADLESNTEGIPQWVPG